jgi:hypothetical protein
MDNEQKNPSDQQQMLVDGLDFLTSKMRRERVAAHISSLACCGCADRLPEKITEMTIFLSLHLKDGSFSWKSLPLSWSSYIPLAKECLKMKFVPFPEVEVDKRNVFQWNDLPNTCQSDIDVVLAGISGDYIRQWQDVPIHLRNNCDVAFSAWKAFLRWNEEYYLSLTHLAPCLNRDFFRKCIEQEKIDDWDDLPQEYREDMEFARSVNIFPSTSMAYSILDKFPDLCEVQETWIKLLKSKSIGTYVGNLLEMFAPVNIVSDHHFMLQACTFDGVLRSVDQSLGHNRSFLTAVLHRYPDQLVHLGYDSQLLFPDLVLSSLQPFSRKDLHVSVLRKLVVALHPSFWSERRNIETWFLAGLPHPHVVDLNDVLAEDWNADEELMLLLAAYCNGKYRKDSFFLVSLSLRNDKTFMWKVLACDPLLFICASEALQVDFDLAVFAFGSTIDVYNIYMMRQLSRDNQLFLETFFKKVNEKLSMHHLFTRLILIGIAQPQCFLSLFGRGNETALSFKKTIAEYLDVPYGPELRLLRHCTTINRV